MVGQYLPQTNEKCYTVLQYFFVGTKHSPVLSLQQLHGAKASSTCAAVMCHRVRIENIFFPKEQS